MGFDTNTDRQKRFLSSFKGYNKDEVDEFLDKTIDSVRKLKNNIDLLYTESNKKIEKLRFYINEIEKVSFESSLRGYSIGRVDQFLDRIVKEIKKIIIDIDPFYIEPNKNNKKSSFYLGEIENKRFSTSFKGYETYEVDMFLKYLEKEIKNLNLRIDSLLNEGNVKVEETNFNAREIENKRFSASFKGYDTDEVDEFLDKIVVEIYKLNSKIKSLIH